MGEDDSQIEASFCAAINTARELKAISVASASFQRQEEHPNRSESPRKCVECKRVSSVPYLVLVESNTRFLLIGNSS